LIHFSEHIPVINWHLTTNCCTFITKFRFSSVIYILYIFAMGLYIFMVTSVLKIYVQINDSKIFYVFNHSRQTQVSWLMILLLKNFRISRAVREAQVVEYLLSKCEALSSQKKNSRILFEYILLIYIWVGRVWLLLLLPHSNSIPCVH
jgi:hypothetical protein